MRRSTDTAPGSDDSPMGCEASQGQACHLVDDRQEKGQATCKKRPRLKPPRAGKNSRWNKDGTKGRQGGRVAKGWFRRDLRQARSPRAGCGGYDLGSHMARERDNLTAQP